MIKKKLVIFPCNGNGIEALDCIDFDQYNVLGFVDDNAEKKSSNFEIFPRSILAKFREISVLAVPGSAISFRTKPDVIRSLNVEPERYVSLIHPNASIGKGVKIGYNCLIMAGVVITSNACLDDHICILPNSVIHHDVRIQDYSIIGSNVVVAGGTTVGNNCYIGSGSNIMNGLFIGDESLVGLGSNVVKDIQTKITVAGNPARELKKT